MHPLAMFYSLHNSHSPHPPTNFYARSLSLPHTYLDSSSWQLAHCQPVTPLRNEYLQKDIKDNLVKNLCGRPNFDFISRTSFSENSSHVFHSYPRLTTTFGSSSSFPSDSVRRKNATRESASTLKSWLREHRKNPYPTKGEKVMLAIVTKMTLTQVSTWFANARRRLKKDKSGEWAFKEDEDEQEEDNASEESYPATLTSPSDNQKHPHPHPQHQKQPQQQHTQHQPQMQKQHPQPQQIEDSAASNQVIETRDIAHCPSYPRIHSSDTPPSYVDPGNNSRDSESIPIYENTSVFGFSKALAQDVNYLKTSDSNNASVFKAFFPKLHSLSMDVSLGDDSVSKSAFMQCSERNNPAINDKYYKYLDIGVEEGSGCWVPASSDQLTPKRNSVECSSECSQRFDVENDESMNEISVENDNNELNEKNDNKSQLNVTNDKPIYKENSTEEAPKPRPQIWSIFDLINLPSPKSVKKTNHCLRQ